MNLADLNLADLAPFEEDVPTYARTQEKLDALLRSTDRAEKRLEAIQARLEALTAAKLWPAAVPPLSSPRGHNDGYSADHAHDAAASIRQEAGRLCRVIAEQDGVELKTVWHNLRESPRFARLRESLRQQWTCEPCPDPSVQTHLVHCVRMLRRLATIDSGQAGRPMTRYTRIMEGASLNILAVD